MVRECSGGVNELMFLLGLFLFKFGLASCSAFLVTTTVVVDVWVLLPAETSLAVRPVRIAIAIVVALFVKLLALFLSGELFLSCFTHPYLSVSGKKKGQPLGEIGPFAYGAIKLTLHPITSFTMVIVETMLT